MGTNFIKSLIAGVSMMLSFSTITFATDYVHQVIILNEGRFDYLTNVQVVPVTIGVYDPATGVYSIFDTIEGERFASDVEIHDDYIYVSADSALLKYDKNTLQRVQQVEVPGILKLAIWGDKILASRGDLDPVTFGPALMESYLQVFNQSDLSLAFQLDTITGPKYATQNIEVINDIAYIGVNNAFEWGNFKGLVGVIDLGTQTYVKELNLGPDGTLPDNIMRSGNKLYTLNNKDYSGSSVSVIDLDRDSIVTTNLPAVSNGCGTSAFFINHVWYQENGEKSLYMFDPNSKTVVDSATLNKTFYGLAVDPVNNFLYGMETDFTSFGKAYVYAPSGVLLKSFDVGLSPGNIAFDVRKVTSLGDNEFSSSQVHVYPNPVEGILNVNLKGLKNWDHQLNVTDLVGKTIHSDRITQETFSIELKSIPTGIYMIVITDMEGNSVTNKIIKL